MTASFYRKYNAFSNRDSAQTEQKHRMTFVGLPDHVYTSIDYGLPYLLYNVSDQFPAWR